MRKKLGNDKTSLGYCGWHKTWDNNKVYLRSKLEFVVARWLDILNIKYETEKYTYNGYKPDFFIFNKHSIIIEVKHCDKLKKEYLRQYKKYFRDLKIKYYVFSDTQIKKLIKKYELNNDIKDWINNSAFILHDMRGEKNPNFGNRFSSETKAKIGEKSKNRFLDSEFREKHSASVKEALKKVPKERFIKKKKFYYREIECICGQCGEKFKRLAKCSIDGRFIKWKNLNDFCKIGCSRAASYKKRRAKEREQAIELIKNFIKEKNRMPQWKEMKKLTGRDIRTLFGNLKNLKEILWEN